jgi:hypothetical protein
MDQVRLAAHDPTGAAPLRRRRSTGVASLLHPFRMRDGRGNLLRFPQRTVANRQSPKVLA